MIEINVREDNLYEGEPIFFNMIIDPTLVLSIKPYRFLDYKAMRARTSDEHPFTYMVEPINEEILGTGCEIFTKNDKFIYVTNSYESLRELIRPSKPV